MEAQNMLVERLMKFMPCTVRPSNSVAHARALLEEQRINHLPVMLNGKLVGIVSTSDMKVSRRSTKAHAIERALEVHPDRVSVGSVMTMSVYTASPSDTLADVADLMRRKRIGALPVLEKGQLCAIITLRQIIDSLSALRKHTANKSATENGRLRPQSENFYEGKSMRASSR